MVKLYVIYSKLRLYLYLIICIISPFRMNLYVIGVLIVEQLINMCGLLFIYIVIYIK